MTKHTFERKNDKLAIVGSHRTTRDGAPWNDDSWDIWVFNEAAQNTWVRRWTGVFNIHQEKNLQASNGIGSQGHWEWLQKDHGEGKVIWTQEADDRIPNSVKFPIDEMVKNFPPAKPSDDRPFFTSTPSYALALGLYLGYKKIHTWGVDLSSNTEYTYQANAWRYWVGVAKGMLGKDFKIENGGKHLFVSKLYGYDDDTRVGADYYKKRADFHDGGWASAKKRCEKLKGGLIDILGGQGELKDFMPLFQETMSAYAEYGKVAGAMGEATRFAERSEILHRQEFEWHAAKAQEESVKLQQHLWIAVGRLEYVFNLWAQTKHPDARNQCMQNLDNIMQMSYNLGFYKGKVTENVFYMNEFDQRLTDAAGDALSDEVLGAQFTKVEA